MHIADVVFTYDNADMLTLLDKRGNAIESLDWKKVAEHNKQIEDLVQGKNAKKEEGDSIDESLR